MLHSSFFCVPELIYDPLRSSFKSYYFTLALNCLRIDRIFLSKMNLIDDLGWIIHTSKTVEKQGEVEVNSEFKFFCRKKLWNTRY